MLLCYKFQAERYDLEVVGFPAKNVTSLRCAALRLAVHLNLHNRQGWKFIEVSDFNSKVLYHYDIGSPLNQLQLCYRGKK